ncbi:MAG TPA: SBBP repeat-containing protein [Pyrinomonadaceae bacterium]|nr:SBBP repeat-containing protein [Pyrinomonadaceae bacterium]
MKRTRASRILKRAGFWLYVFTILLNSSGLAQLPPAHAQATANLLKRAVASSSQPLSFEVNQGQAEPQTRFLVRGHQFVASLSAAQAAVSMGNESLSLQFVGASRKAQAVGEQLLNEKTNYLIGNNPKEFRTNIPHYARARFNRVYSGVDVVYSGDQGRLKYDIIVAPGVDPNVIKIKYAGIKTLRTDLDGNLLLNMASGDVVQPKPIVYQSFENERRHVNGNYIIQGKNQIGFRIEAYDRSKPLVIDPVLVFATYLGGSGIEEGMGVATDFEGNAYVVGTTTSLNFPITPGALQTTGSGGKNVFVTKLNPGGTGVVYSTYLGGSLNDSGYGIAVDGDGNAYITGTTASTNFPITTGALRTANGGGTDAFVTKLNKTGSALVYSSYLGGGGNEEGFGIALDFNGNANVTGVTASSNFIVTSGAMQASLAGPTDAFVTRLNPSGTAPLFSTYIGGSSTEIGFAIAIDLSNNTAIVTGVTESINFPATTGALRTISAGSSDAFVVKLDSSGSASYATFLGGNGIDVGFGVAVDINGNAYINGLTDSSNFPTTPGTMQPLYAGGESDAFVTKLGPTGATLIYSTYLGGSGTDTGAGIALGFGGKAILSGTTSSNNFPVTGDATQSILNGGKDAFLSRLLHDGSGPVYSSLVGGGQGEEAFGLAIDAGANSYVSGATSSSNFPTTTGAFRTTSAGGTDSFVIKVGPGSDSPIHLLLDTSGPVADQVAGLDSIRLLRDPLPLLSSHFVLLPPDQHTRVMIFVANLQLAPGATASSVIVNLSGNNQSRDIAAEAVRQVPSLYLAEVIFRLPDGLSAGTYVVRVKAHGQTSNAGTFKITN